MSELGIDPEQINAYVARQIAESAIGEALRASIDEEVKRLASSYNNPMKPVVGQAIAEAARDYLETPEVKERLRAVVEASLTEDAIGGFIARIVSESWRTS